MSSVLLTLRLQIPASLAADISFESAYPVIAWMCWVPNLLVAEWMLHRRRAIVDGARVGGQGMRVPRDPDDFTGSF